MVLPIQQFALDSIDLAVANLQETQEKIQSSELDAPELFDWPRAQELIATLVSTSAELRAMSFDA